MKYFEFAYNQLRELFDPSTFGSPDGIQKTSRPQRNKRSQPGTHVGVSRRMIRI